MNRLLAIQKLVYDVCCQIRLKVYNEDYITDWKSGFGLPVEGYIEVSGPERISDVEWIELDPVVVTRIGRLVPPKVSIILDEIIQVLQQESIDYQVVKGMVRIDGQQLS
ncbi:hypothetical protein MTX78_04215 [Hymenobacter tibetensis]|uniref:Uncharacterized protein n=1 Tax=Hymenobacter tibetensis TaxID=497967 RepID=A0ABY4CZW3_9BACT|nr:DUF6678 family protein [Hymenobacter tibetensis]UOG75805.1 hypothetical protein MTX78_04215 [Hymenobacter tibetensis]